MQKIDGVEKLLCVSPRKRFGQRWELGTRFYGASKFGDWEKYHDWQPFGSRIYGDFTFADLMILSGIWREWRTKEGRHTWRGPYYITKNPRYENQQTWRGTFAAAVLAWQALTNEQKMAYHKLSIGKQMSGYNVFLREYLLSH